jgi:DNA-binding NtrC family response regulator
MATPRILIAEDEENLRRLMGMLLANSGYKLTLAHDGREAIEALAADRFDLLITDLKMPRADGMALVRHVHEEAPDLPVIVITAFGSIESAVEAMQAGAIDYIAKPFEEEKLKLAIERGLRVRRLLTENRALRREVHGRWSLEQFVTRSPAMREAVSLARRVAASHANVMIYGESGTGKELLTRAIHNAGPRAAGPLIAINCAAIADSLLESELFGHEKGSFTGAFERKIGKFELADGGTLFLDEIGDLSPSVQAKVLRAIENREFQRVGGTAGIHVDARFIAATNKRLAREVAEGRFREDLYFRLNVFPITLPPLRERPEDIMPLVEKFLAAFCEQMGKRVPAIPPETRERLESDPWMGNVRELQNAIERAVILLRGDALTPELIRKSIPQGRVAAEAPVNPGAPPLGVDGAAVPGVNAGGAGSSDGFRIPDKGFSMEAHEKWLLMQALTRCRGRKTAAARLLGVSRATLRYRMEKYGLIDDKDAKDDADIKNARDGEAVAEP